MFHSDICSNQLANSILPTFLNCLKPAYSVTLFSAKQTTTVLFLVSVGSTKVDT